MGTYLTKKQIERIQADLGLLYSLPHTIDLFGTAWEKVLADAKGGKATGLRDNRPRPDITVVENGKAVNYSVKTEGLRKTVSQSRAKDFLGSWEDLIVARPKVDELLSEGESIESLSADELGALVLRYYNERIVEKYKWDVLAILLRVGETEFIYWEERPVPKYPPKKFKWQDSGRATGNNRNINGYPHGEKVGGGTSRAKFKWTSGGKQFYVLYQIPTDADILRIKKWDLTIDEVRQALRELLTRKAALKGLKLPT